jgi:hypothetical protein
MIRAIEAAGLTWWLMFNFVLFLLLNRPRSRRWTAPSFGRQSHHRVMEMSGDCHRALRGFLAHSYHRSKASLVNTFISAKLGMQKIVTIILQDVSQASISRSIARCASRSARPSSITVLSQPIAWLARTPFREQVTSI